MEEHKEFLRYTTYAHTNGLKTCLYCGRDTTIEEWMNSFDYIKLGSFIENLGPLTSPQTNQRLYKKVKQNYIDITELFWSAEQGSAPVFDCG